MDRGGTSFNPKIQLHRYLKDFTAFEVSSNLVWTKKQGC